LATGESRAGELTFCVDAGGSKSRARLVDSQGRTLAEALSGPCNPATNLDRSVESIGDLWRQCSAVVGRGDNSHEGVVFAIGAAGTYLHGRDAFLSACPPFARVAAMSDGYAALIGAGLGAPCSLIIIGTGVAGHRLFANGASIQRDAWGWIAGDRGSGSWMGQKALRHFLAALDGVVPHDELSRAVLHSIGGIERLREGWMKDLGPDRLAALAPLVIEEAKARDGTARRIRDRAVEHLAATIGVIAGADAKLYAAGGLVAPLRPFLERKTGLSILEPSGDALTGAWLVASGKAPVEHALFFGETVEQLS
jgi:glucosamine kinase